MNGAILRPCACDLAMLLVASQVRSLRVKCTCMERKQVSNHAGCLFRVCLCLLMQARGRSWVRLGRIKCSKHPGCPPILTQTAPSTLPV